MIQRSDDNAYEADLDRLLDEARLGLLAEEFRAGPLGSALRQRALAEIEECKCQLAEVDPDDAKKIRQIQNELWRNAKALGWIDDLITNGQLAAEQLRVLEERG